MGRLWWLPSTIVYNSHLHSVYYETEAPRWIGGSFFKVTDAERKIALRYLMWIQATNDPNVPWIKPMEIIQPEQA